MKNNSRVAATVACLVLASVALGAPDAAPTTAPAAAKVIASFEKDSPFVHEPIVLEFPEFEKQPPDPKMEIVSEHAPAGGKALKIHNGSLSLHGPLDWAGYDYLKLEVFSDCKEPKLFMLLLEDDNTQDHHWWEGQIFGAIMPGANSLVLPIADSKGGGKGRPYKPLVMNKLKRATFKIFQGDLWSPNYDDTDAMYLSSIRLENDTDAKAFLFPGLEAYDLGSDTSPVMPGFKRLGPSDVYTKEKGFGVLEGSKLVGPEVNGKRALDFFRPDPLYRDSICVQQGGFAFNLPNGKYRVFMNLDFGGGFWGEYQFYRQRKVIANGKTVVDDAMTFDQLKDRYFSHYDIEDWPGLDVWDKYVKPTCKEKTFDVEVTDGVLKLECQGDGLACAVSAIVIYPEAKAAEGRKFLTWVEAKRKWWFQNENKEVAHKASGKDFAATGDDQKRGFALFSRGLTEDVFHNDKPEAGETIPKLEAVGFAGQSLPMNVGIVPLMDLGKVTVSVGKLEGASGASIAPDAFEVGYVSYRIRRTAYEGTMYTMAPRYIRPENAIAMPKDITRRFWVRGNVPATAAPGVYRGHVTIATEKAGSFDLPIEIQVLHGKLDAVDVPAGPIGHRFGIPWFGDDPQAKAFNAKLADGGLKLIHDSGFTSFTGMPNITYKGFKDGQPVIDFTVADAEMKQARAAGFDMPILSYCGFGGLNIYTRDLGAMKAAGFTDYAEFLKAVFSAVQKHADENHWLSVYYVLGDEPAGKEDILAATENAQAFRKAFPSGPPWFTLFGSCVASDEADLGLQLAKAYHAIAWNVHNEGSVEAVKKLGGAWGIYNWASRWGYGDHLFKAVKQYGCKFLVSWHWNCAGGDPFFGLDGREDDYCWVNATPDGRLMRTPTFERVREGLVDYRCLLTLDRLAREKAATPAGKEARELITKRLDSFKLDTRDGLNDFEAFRKKVVEAIDKLSTPE